VLQNFLHYVFGQAGGDGEADSLVTAATGKHGGIDPDEIALGVDQRAAGIAGIDRGVGLDEVLKSIYAELVAAGGADNAHGHGLPHAEGIADGQHHVADAQIVGMAERDDR